jgi:murein endopeptidase
MGGGSYGPSVLRERALSCLLALAAGLPRVAAAASPPHAGDVGPVKAPGRSPPGADDLPGVLDEPTAPDAPAAPPETAAPDEGGSVDEPPTSGEPGPAAESLPPDAPELDPADGGTDAQAAGVDDPPEPSTPTFGEPRAPDDPPAEQATAGATLAIVPRETTLRPEGRAPRDGPAFSPKRRARRPASTEDAPKLPAVKARPRVAAVRHTVTKGETWRTLAKRSDVEEKRLRRWNHGRARRLKKGEVLHVWVEIETPPQSVQGLLATLPPLEGEGSSVGLPNRGHLEDGVAIPTMPSWWTLRRPDEAYGSAFAVSQLTQAIARYRLASGRYDPLSIGSMSRKTGGKLRPHSSHQSGRDIDIRLPLRRDLPAKEIPDELEEVDWDATWILVKSFIDSGQVEFIFLDASRQAELAAAARRAQASAAQLDEWLQWPRPTNANAGVVRDEPGHTSHLHVRFRCGPEERECRSR